VHLFARWSKLLILSVPASTTVVKSCPGFTVRKRLSTGIVLALQYYPIKIRYLLDTVYLILWSFFRVIVRKNQLLTTVVLAGTDRINNLLQRANKCTNYYNLSPKHGIFASNLYVFLNCLHLDAMTF
jgi:hypothetical protein